MYWNQPNLSSMENLLDKHDTKLETILSIDNILLHVKNGDKKLMNFLSQPDHLMKLFSYAVATNLPEEKAIKYPYLACEIICADNGRFVDAMRKNSNIISPLWAFLEGLKPRHLLAENINNSVTGEDSPSAIQNGAIFFSRLNIFLFNKMLPNMLKFLDERVPDAFVLLVENLDLQPIAELMYRFYALHTTENEILDWIDREKLHLKLADQLAPQKGIDLHMAVAQFIKGLFALPFSESFPKHLVIGPFLKADWLNLLLSKMFESCESDEAAEREESSIVYGLEILSSILNASAEFALDDNKSVLEGFMEGFMNHFDTFYDLLRRGPQKSIELSSGKTEIFGRIRLGSVQLFSSIISVIAIIKDESKQSDYVKALERAQLIPTMMDAFFHFRHHNLFHDLVVQIMRTIFSRKELFSPLIGQLLKEYQLKRKIVELQRENDAQVQKPRGNRLAHIGHLTLIAECVIDWEASFNTLTSSSFIVSQIPDDNWREYTNKSFRETRLKDKKVLGGIKPPASMNEMFSSSEDSGDELLNYNSVFRSGDEEQLARYFCQQLIGNFPDHFLYASSSEDEQENEHFLDDDYNDDDDDDDDEAMGFIFETDSNRRNGRRRLGKKKSDVAKSIEIPILMAQDDFDEEMFDDSFTSSLLSDEEDDEDADRSDSDSDSDFDM